MKQPTVDKIYRWNQKDGGERPKGAYPIKGTREVPKYKGVVRSQTLEDITPFGRFTVKHPTFNYFIIRLRRKNSWFVSRGLETLGLSKSGGPFGSVLHKVFCFG